MEYPRKYDIIFHLGLPQEYADSYSPRRGSTTWRNLGSAATGALGGSKPTG